MRFNKKARGNPGIEPGASSTLKMNHTTRLIALIEINYEIKNLYF